MSVTPEMANAGYKALLKSHQVFLRNARNEKLGFQAVTAIYEAMSAAAPAQKRGPGRPPKEKADGEEA